MKKENKNRFFWVAGLVLIFGLCVGFQAYAFGPHFGRMGMGALMDLDLTDAQKKEISDILEKQRPKGEALKEKLRPFFTDAFSAGEFDEDQARAKFKEAVPLFEEMYILKQTIKNDIRGVLTDDQIARLKEKRERFVAKRGERKKCRRACMKGWLEPERE